MSEYRNRFQETEREIYWSLPKILVLLFVVGVAFAGLGLVFSWFGEGAKVVQDQFGPEALLRKYEWFKDASAVLDKKQADIGVYHTRLKSLDEIYSGAPRGKWARDDREQYSIWSSEEAGVKASYNQLAAEYNSEMSKFNYRFANVGDLPRGADKPLPRAYKPYLGE